MEIKLCKDCKHFRKSKHIVFSFFGLFKNAAIKYGTCQRPYDSTSFEYRRMMSEVLTGAGNVQRPTLNRCASYERFHGACGKHGTYFELKVTNNYDDK